MADLASALLGDLKRKTFPQQLAEQASSTSPGNWAVALARALQGGMAGYFENQDNEQAGKQFDQAYGPAVGGQTTPAAPSLGQRLGAMLTGGGDKQPEVKAPAVASTASPRVYEANELSPIDAQAASPQQRMAAYGPTIDAAAKQNNLDPKMLARQLTQESGLNPMAVSPKGAMGIGQLMPGTARDLGVTDPNDPQQSINGAATYMRQNLDKFGGNPQTALAAYNWGPGNVQQWQAQGGDPSKLPAETQGYIRNITGDPAALPQNSQLAQGTLPAAQPSTNPQMNVTRVAPQIPPDVYQRARAMAVAGNPVAATAAIQKYTDPKDQELPLVTPAERAAAGIPATDMRPYQRNSSTNKVSSVDNAPTITMQANTTGETEYSKGKAQDALGLERSADKALMERQQLQVFKSLVQDFKTGKLAPAQMTMGAWGDAIGLDPKTLEKIGIPANAGVNGQLIESLSNQMTLGMIGTKGGEGGSMPANNFSDADRKFLQNTVPGLARMQGGNLVLAEIKQRGLDRTLDKVAMWDDYRSQGKKYEDFERDWRAKLKTEPSLFADIPDMVRGLSGQQNAAGGQSQGDNSAQGGVRKYNPATGRIE